MKTNVAWILVPILLVALNCKAQEVLIEGISLPGASLRQEVTYHPTKAEYERVRDETLVRLQKGDKTAFVNPQEGPWMRVETTAEIGILIKDFGISKGRKNYRQVSAAEEALYLYEKR